MIEINFESVVLREMGIKKKPDEIRPEQRRNLRQFCKTWADALDGLDTF